MYCKHCGNEVEQGQKFCGKCGCQLSSSEMEDADQSGINSYADESGQDKKVPKKRSKRSIAIAIGACCVLAIMLGAVYLATNNGQKKPANDIESTLAMMTEANGGELPEIAYNDADNKPSFITGRFSNRIILDDEDARLAIADVSALFGDDGIAENLELFNESEFDGIKFYRFKQLHQGYEVFGRQLVLAADAGGSAFSLNGQYEMIDSIETGIDIEESQAWNRASELGDDTPIGNRGIVVYVSQGSGVLAWEIECEESIKLISAQDGSLLCSVPIVYDGAGVDKAHGAKDTIQFNTEIDEDGKYVLLDKTRNISYHNAAGKKVNLSYEIVNENWDVLFTYGTGQSGIRDVSDGSLITFDAYNATVTGTECRLCDLGPDGARRISVANCYTDNPDAGVPLYTDDDNEWEDKYILNAVGAINKAYDFYLKLGWKGLNGHNHPLRVYANDARESGDSGNASANASGYISIGKDNDAEYEFLAHEYTHLVLFGMANLGISNNPGAETKALHEAYSDIMAIISNRDDKWSWADNTRNLADPAKNDQKKESGQHLSLYSPDNMQEEEHLDSTIIGHAAYLMYERGLSFDDLEKLWFGSMHFLDPSSDFYTCRYAVLTSARGLGFGSAKTEIIKSAFDDANIRRFDVSSMSVAPNGKIYAEDHNGDRITSFTVELRYAGSEFGNLRGSVACSAKTDDGCIDMSSVFGGEPLVGYYFIDVHAEGAAQEYGPIIHVDTNGASELVITLPVLVVYLDSNTNNQRYESYLEKVEEYQSKCGEGKIVDAGTSTNTRFMKGLCLVDLIDFDNDGDEELLLGYYDESQANYYTSDSFADAQAYRSEIWGYENSNISKLYESDFHWTNGGFAYLPVYHRSNDVAMYKIDYSTDSGNRSVGTNSIWVLNGDAFEETTTFSTYGMWGTGKVEYEIDGNIVDEDTYKTYFDDVMGDYAKTSYWMTWNDESGHHQDEQETLNDPNATLKITRETIKKLKGESDSAGTDEAWAQFPQSFIFTSGAGAWSTQLDVAADGTFSGYYHDSDMGDRGGGYPNGTRHETHFVGEFTTPVKVSEFEYNMQLNRLEITDSAGETIEDGMRVVHVTDSVYGLGEPTEQPAGEFSLHLPGQSLSSFSDSAASWLFIKNTSSQGSDFYAIVNSSDPAYDLAFRTIESTGATTVQDVDDEGKLKNYVEANAGHEVLYWFYEDFDGDGSREAMAIAGVKNEARNYEGEWTDGGIWYANKDGTRQVGWPGSGNALNGLVKDGKTGYTFLSIERDGHGSGSSSEVYVVESDGCSVAIFDVSSVGNFHNDNGRLIGYTQTWENGFHEYAWHEFEFHPENATFTSKGIFDVTSSRKY